jgi:hypothetical protein
VGDDYSSSIFIIQQVFRLCPLVPVWSSTRTETSKWSFGLFDVLRFFPEVFARKMARNGIYNREIAAAKPVI